MNFDFSEDLKLLREQARKFLSEKSSPKSVRKILEGAAPYDAELWRAVAQMGWLRAPGPEAYRGAALRHDPLCGLAAGEGDALAPLPLSSPLYLAREGLLAPGS